MKMHEGIRRKKENERNQKNKSKTKLHTIKKHDYGNAHKNGAMGCSMLPNRLQENHN